MYGRRAAHLYTETTATLEFGAGAVEMWCVKGVPGMRFVHVTTTAFEAGDAVMWCAVVVRVVPCDPVPTTGLAFEVTTGVPDPVLVMCEVPMPTMHPIAVINNGGQLTAGTEEADISVSRGEISTETIPAAIIPASAYRIV